MNLKDITLAMVPELQRRIEAAEQAAREACEARDRATAERDQALRERDAALSQRVELPDFEALFASLLKALPKPEKAEKVSLGPVLDRLAALEAVLTRAPVKRKFKVVPQRDGADLIRSLHVEEE